MQIKKFVGENITQTMALVKKEMGNDGRILIRTSGTEPLIRIMAEGSNKEQVTHMVSTIATAIEREVNAN